MELVEQRTYQDASQSNSNDNSRRTSQDSSERSGSTPDLEHGPVSLQRTQSHVSTTHDVATADSDQGETYHEAGDEIYNKYTHKRKVTIVTVLSICSFLAPISSTSILAAAPEVVEEFNTTGAIFGLSNALYMICMGVSALLYGPLGTAFGRQWPLRVAAVTFTAFSLGSALAPNLAAYFAFRILSALQGTCFLIVGSTVVGDIYRPIERGTAYGWFLSGTLIGPALGPFVGGIIVTYASWRGIFWLQTAMSAAATLGVLFFIPETAHRTLTAELKGLSREQQARKLASWINPWRVLVLFRYPNVLIAGIASGALVWNMYSLLTPVRYVLNPRFGLDSPLEGGLFYIAPGGGYLAGTFIGGRYADRTVKRYIAKRNGNRIPEDRLRSCLVCLGVIIPACMLIYGWSIEKRVGGIPLPVICMFLQGVAQLICFPSLNTYCVDVMQKRSSETVAGNYVMRYVFAAAGTAASLPTIERIGVGWFSTISAAFLVAAGGALWVTAEHGSKWRERVGKDDDEY